MSAAIIFRGELSISDVCARFEGLKPAFQEGIKNKERLSVNCEGITGMDVAGAQALIALKKECVRHNREFVLRLSGAAAERLASLGIEI